MVRTLENKSSRSVSLATATSAFEFYRDQRETRRENIGLGGLRTDST